MELNGPGAQIREIETLDRPVVQRDVRRLASLARLHSEPVVLARDQHPAAPTLQHRMVRAAMAELELERPVPGGEREQLVPEANAEHRHLSEQVCDGGDLAL